ncbi:YceI family protein [Lysobacter sp. A286]
MASALPAHAGATDPAPPGPVDTGGDAADEMGFDPLNTQFSFELRTRWGQHVQGRFPVYDGAKVTLPDGRSQIYVRLATNAVEVTDSLRYSELARGEGFFDAQRYPVIEFVSEPLGVALGHDGGKFRGRLSMHGVSRIETFTLAPSTCMRPAMGCDAVAVGSVSRRDYGLDGWRLMLTDQVQFTMRVRLREPTPTP